MNLSALNKSLLDRDSKLKRVVDCILDNDTLDYYIS